MTDPGTTHPPAPDIRYRSVLEMLRGHARRAPDQPCLISIDQGASLTWHQLYRLSNKLSAWLHDRAIGANDRVLVLTDNSLENLILYYGIQRHGATFCTVNVDINANHLQEIIARLNPRVVLCDDTLDQNSLRRDTLPDSTGCDWISFGTADSEGQNSADNGLFEALNTLEGETEPDVVSGAEDDAVICFTSGTTERPKGVIHSFANYNLIGDQTAWLWGLTVDDRVLEYRSFSWSSSHQIVLQPLLVGGGCVTFARKFSFSRLFDWIRKYRPTKCIGIPAVVNMLLDSAPEDGKATDETVALSSLEFMSCSTAPLMEEQHRRFEKIYGLKLIQHYGMSEGGTVAGNHYLTRRIGSVGKPGLAQNLSLIGEDGAPVAAGHEGEIEIGGPQNATAYLNPDGTREPVRGQRLKTGDLGILDADGYLRITGRAKDLIIRGGVNIAPLEIDETVMQHPDVHEACTVGIPDPIYGEAIACFVVPRTGRRLTVEDISGHCASLLPDVKRPDTIIVTEDIARNARGKTDRNAMKERWMTLPKKRGK